jgi:hypothetical protein
MRSSAITKSSSLAAATESALEAVFATIACNSCCLKVSAVTSLLYSVILSLMSCFWASTLSASSLLILASQSWSKDNCLAVAASLAASLSPSSLSVSACYFDNSDCLSQS